MTNVYRITIETPDGIDVVTLECISAVRAIREALADGATVTVEGGDPQAEYDRMVADL